MRLFIGVRIPEDIKEGIVEVGRKLQSKVREARIVPSENLHITLKFLGEVTEEKVPRINEVLSDTLKNYKSFKMEVKGAGVFPDEKKIRVFWIGADSRGKMKKLSILIEDYLESEGFTKENRFREHITIARFKSTPKISFLKGLLERYKEENFGVMQVKEIELIKSELRPSGSIYSTFCVISLSPNFSDVT
jgi:RNA 2',3'-cyclic 3'-phosphodiesterase